MLNYQFNPKSWDQQIIVQPFAPNTQALVTTGTYTAGTLPMNGAFTSYGGNFASAVLATPANVVITSAANDSANSFLILGTNSNDVQISENLVGANAARVTSVHVYKTVISITPSFTTASTVLVGISGSFNVICTSQTGTSGVGLILNGTDSAGFYFAENKAQYLTWTCADDETANTLTIKGLDAAGRSYTYSVAGVNAGFVLIPIPYNNIAAGGLTLAIDTTGNISLGLSAQTATPWLAIDKARDVMSCSLTAYVNGTAPNLTYTVEYTNDPFQGAGKGYPTAPVNTVNDVTLVNQTGTNSAGLNNPVSACRLVISAWTAGYVLFQLIQAGDRTASPVAI